VGERRRGENKNEDRNNDSVAPVHPHLMLLVPGR
jgi:hypothetical protein